MVSDHVKANELQAFLDRVVGPEAKEAIMTAGEQLIQQGEERGLQKGIEQGLQKGIEQGERALLMRLLRKRFGNQVDETVVRRVESASAEEIATWGERLLSGTTLDDLLAS